MSHDIAQETRTIGESLVLEGSNSGPGFRIEEPDMETRRNREIGIPGYKQLTVIEDFLLDHQIPYSIQPDSLSIVYSLVMEIDGWRLASNCISQVHLNIKDRRPEFLFSDFLLGIEVGQDELYTFACALCNTINDEAATSGGHVVYSRDMKRFRYRNGTLLPEGRLSKDLVGRLMYYASIVADGFLNTLLFWVEAHKYKISPTSDSYYKIQA